LLIRCSLITVIMLANDFLVSDFFRITTIISWAISTQYICVGLQIQQIEELTVVHAGLRHANEFRHPAEGVHHRMHLDAALPPRPSSGFRPTPRSISLKSWMVVLSMTFRLRMLKPFNRLSEINGW